MAAICNDGVSKKRKMAVAYLGDSCNQLWKAEKRNDRRLLSKNVSAK